MGKWEMAEQMTNGKAGALRRQESLPLCSQTENKDGWKRVCRKNGRLKVQKSLSNSITSSLPVSLQTQSILMFLFLHLPSNELSINRSSFLSSSRSVLLSFLSQNIVYSILHSSILIYSAFSLFRDNEWRREWCMNLKQHRNIQTTFITNIEEQSSSAVNAHTGTHTAACHILYNVKYKLLFDCSLVQKVQVLAAKWLY